MRKPTLALRGSTRRLRRPSPAMAVALVALFLSIGGASYAAVTLPAGSVGSAQLRNFAVTNPKIANASVGFRKIMPGAVGVVRIDKNQVQLRVAGTCTAANQAITSINIDGGTTCGSTSPSESDTGAPTAKPILTTATMLASLALPGGTQYMVQASPYITVTGNTDTSAQTVDVSCTLAAGTTTTATETRTVSIYVPAGTVASPTSASASIPLTVVQAASPNATTATLSCMDATTGGIVDATLDGAGTVYALTLAPPSTSTSTSTTTTTTTTAAAVSVRHP